MIRFLLCCSSGDAELGARAAEALVAAGHTAAAPVSDGSDAAALAAALRAADLCVLLVTRGGAREPLFGRLLEAAREAGRQVLIVWWDEDAPSDFLGAEARRREAVEIFYACFLPLHDRIAALVERLRDEPG